MLSSNYKKYFLILTLFILSTIASIVLGFFAIETNMRIRAYGFKNGLQSFLRHIAPSSKSSDSSWVIADDELGYRLNPNLSEVNQYSMKNEEISNKQLNSYRIFILGDSVPYLGDPNFVDLLKENLTNYSSGEKKIEIINASTPGYTNYQELLFLKKYIIELQPDLVLLCFVLNDNHSFLHYFDEENNMLWTEEAKSSLFANSKLDFLIKNSLFLSQIKASLFSQQQLEKQQYKEKWWLEAVDFNTGWKDESWKITKSQIKEMQSVLKSQNAQLSVVVFPLEFQISSDFSVEKYEEIIKPQIKLKEITDAYNIPLLDLFVPFYQEQDQNKELKLFTDGLHLSDHGHILSAKLIREFILKQI